MSSEDHDISSLSLGWKVDGDGHPSYWLVTNARPGSQPNEDLVRISADLMANHTIIIASSGSGKSFFLGRLIEELLLKTKARCLVLDPNADFKRVHETEEEELWKRARYDIRRNSGKLPTEASRQDFESKWSKIPKRILTNDHSLVRKEPYEPLKIWWPSVSFDFLSEDLTPIQRSQVFHCHAFVNAIASVMRRVDLLEKEIDGSDDSSKKIDVIKQTELLFRWYRKSPSTFETTLREKLIPKRIANIRKGFGLVFVQQSILPEIQRARKAIKYVSKEGRQFYFAKATQYSELLSNNAMSRHSPQRSITVIDLPSLQGRSNRLLVANALLEHEIDLAREDWARAQKRDSSDDKRVPTFIVCDEAHNLAPAETSGRVEEVLRDQFRNIAAEGRKYGLFLILVSQRPERLDPLVVSECDNKALMKLNSKSVLEAVTTKLGLEDIPPKTLEECLKFGKGRILLYGTWSKGSPQILYSAARRTVEGGRNLRAEYWANETKGK